MRVLLQRMIYIILTLALTCNGATDIDRAYYPEWSAALDLYGYDWEVYQVKTEDGWYLSLFRILGRQE